MLFRRALHFYGCESPTSLPRSACVVTCESVRPTSGMDEIRRISSALSLRTLDPTGDGSDQSLQALDVT